MRKIAFCLISFLTLSLPCEMSWGETPFQTSYNAEKDADEGVTHDWLAILRVLGSRFAKKSGNALAIKNPTDGYTILASGGDDALIKKILNELPKRIADQSSGFGLNDLISRATATDVEDLSGDLLKSRDDEVDSYVSDTRIANFWRGLDVYIQQTADMLSRWKTANPTAVPSDDELRAITTEIAAIWGRLMAAVSRLEDTKKKKIIAKCIVEQMMLPTTHVAGSREIKDTLGDSMGETSYEDMHKLMGWIKYLLHTEVTLYWAIRRGFLSIAENTPVLSSQLPCKSCSYTPGLDEWAYRTTGEGVDGCGFLCVRNDKNGTMRTEAKNSNVDLMPGNPKVAETWLKR